MKQKRLKKRWPVRREGSQKRVVFQSSQKRFLKKGAVVHCVES